MFKPGEGMNIDVTLDTETIAAPAPKRTDGNGRFRSQHHSQYYCGSFAKGEILQVLLIAVLFGFRCSSAGAAPWCLISSKKNLHVLFSIVNVIMKLR
jgi:aerobic C4-dicarboxylate transport protein